MNKKPQSFYYSKVIQLSKYAIFIIMNKPGYLLNTLESNHVMPRKFKNLRNFCCSFVRSSACYIIVCANPYSQKLLRIVGSLGFRRRPTYFIPFRLWAYGQHSCKFCNLDLKRQIMYEKRPTSILFLLEKCIPPLVFISNTMSVQVSLKKSIQLWQFL